MVNTYFAACNSKNGFYSLFDSIFFSDPKRRVYILKGGPGTGKSYFMKRIAEESERLGYETVRYLCSSDPDSLDGVSIPKLHISVIDGTSPHSADAISPGVTEYITDLGRFFDTDKLMAHRDEILKLCHVKSEHYKRAYAYLHVCGEILDIRLGYVKKAVMFDKLSSAAKRESERYGSVSDVCDIDRVFVSSLGVRGQVCTDAFMSASNRIGVCDSLGTGHIFLGVLADELAKRVGKITVYPDPLCPERISGLYIPESDTCYMLISQSDERFGRVINQRRFIDKKILGDSAVKLRFTEKVAESLKNEALCELAKAGAVHADIEKIYKSSMDFKSKEKFTEEFVRNLFKPC